MQLSLDLTHVIHSSGWRHSAEVDLRVLQLSKSQVVVERLWQQIFLLMTPQRATDCSLWGIASRDYSLSEEPMAMSPLMSKSEAQTTAKRWIKPYLHVE